jgi:ubiquinone/menaquinone biosynthesis C-methylase UbiE
MNQPNGAPDPQAMFAAMFDKLATTYDQSGVPFFTTIAQGLVDRLAPAPGERVVDIGCGRGAATFALAEAVGTTGSVDGLDIAPTMVELTASAARDLGLDHVSVAVGDAADPQLPAGGYDAVCSSLVLFFLADPRQALSQWRALLADGGRLGFSTFRPWPATWQAVEDVFAEHLPADSPPTTRMPEVFETDEGVETLAVDAGFGSVRTEGVTYPIRFADVDQWRTWSMSTAMRGLWMSAPPETHPEIMARVERLLDDADGTLEVAIRYTFGRA